MIKSPLDMILDEDYESLDPQVPNILLFLRQNGVCRLWHKNGSFYQHLLGVWQILQLWEVEPWIAQAGLLHSIYGSSFAVSGIIKDRSKIRSLVGDKCEEVIFKFCQIDRKVMEKRLLDNPIPDSLTSLPTSKNDREYITFSPKELAAFILISLADFLEQHNSWQEIAWVKETKNSCLNLSKKEMTLLLSVAPQHSYGLWPGNRSPFATRFHYLFSLARSLHSLTEHIKTPAIFKPDYLGIEKAKYGIAIEDEIIARNLYKQILREDEEGTDPQVFAFEKAVEQISKIIVLNPYIGEPCLLKAQMNLRDKNDKYRLKEAHNLTMTGLKHLASWGCAWDKRMSFSGWITWGRHLLIEAQK